MGPGAPSADTPCGNTGGTARYAAEVSRDNSGAGRARKLPLARGKPSLPGLSVSRSCSQPEHLLYTISPPARAAGAASAPRPMREQRPTPTSPRRNGKRPTHATSCGGAAGEKTGRGKGPDGPPATSGRYPPDPPQEAHKAEARQTTTEPRPKRGGARRGGGGPSRAQGANQPGLQSSRADRN